MEEQRARALDAALDNAVEAMRNLAIVVPAPKLTRALTLIVDAAASELGPWAFTDNNAEPRISTLRLIADAVAATSTHGVGPRPDREHQLAG